MSQNILLINTKCFPINYQRKSRKGIAACTNVKILRSNSIFKGSFFYFKVYEHFYKMLCTKVRRTVKEPFRTHHPVSTTSNILPCVFTGTT